MLLSEINVIIFVIDVVSLFVMYLLFNDVFSGGKIVFCKCLNIFVAIFAFFE